MRLSFWLRINGSESSFNESWHWMFRALEASGQSAKYLAAATVQGVGVHWFILWPLSMTSNINLDQFPGVTSMAIWRTHGWPVLKIGIPWALKSLFLRYLQKSLVEAPESRCQGLFMKVMKVSWKSFQSKYIRRTYWVLMVLFTFVWFFNHTFLFEGGRFPIWEFSGGWLNHQPVGPLE